MSDTNDNILTAENVQKVIQGVLDASNELMTEFISKKRAAKWDIINDGLFAAERLNGILSEKLRELGIEPTTSKSKREKG